MNTAPSITTLRRRARAQGISLRGTGVRNERDPRYGKFVLVDERDFIVSPEMGMSAEEIDEFLTSDELHHERERKAALIDLYGTKIGSAIRTFSNFGAYDDPTVNLRDYPAQLIATTEFAKYYQPEHLHNARRFIDALIEWSER